MTLLEQLAGNFAQRLNRVTANSIWTFKSQLKMWLHYRTKCQTMWH